MNKEKINETIKKSISDQDLERYFNKSIYKKIISFGDLRKYTSIDKFLPKPKDFIILLIETSKNVGHWVCLTKNHDTITFFDSYGYFPGDELKFVDADKRVQLHEDHNYLLDLIKQSRYKFDYNNIKYQSFKTNVNDCGRWVILYLILFNEKDITLKGFHQFITQKTKQLKLSNDQLVSYLIE